MTTYYMQGCSDENQAVAYFDKMYIPVQEMISLDNSMQEDLEALLVTEEQLDSNISDVSLNFESLDKSFELLNLFIENKMQETKGIEVYKNEFQIKQAYEKLLSSYRKELQDSYPKIFAIMKKEEVAESEIAIFNILLQESQITLDHVLGDFYTVAADYAQRYEIEIEEED